MKAIFRFIVIALTFFAIRAEAQKLQYPPTKIESVDTVMFGITVHDPYRWLETDTAATRQWLDAQSGLTNSYLSEIPERELIRTRIDSLWDYEKFGVPVRYGNKWFYDYNPGSLNHSVLFVMDSLGAQPREILNPNSFSHDGSISVARRTISPDGTYIVYALARGGSDWWEWHIRIVTTGQDLPDVVRWSKSSGAAWRWDELGFYYSRYEAPSPGQELTAKNINNQIFFHKVGTQQTEDVLIYERRDHEDWRFFTLMSTDRKHLLIHVSGGGVGNGLFYKDIQRNGEVVELFNEFGGTHTFVANDGPTWWFCDNLNFPNGRLIAIDIRDKKITEVIPESDNVLEGVTLVGNTFIARYLENAHSVVKQFTIRGELIKEVELPGIGTAAGFGGLPPDTLTYFSFTNFARPVTIYRFDVKEGKSELYRQPRLKFNPDDYETILVHVTSKDGTIVPMFVSYRKGTVLDGNNPTYLYGYGGWGFTFSPSFSVFTLAWMEMGGVYAFPMLRGDGTLGREWHEGGMRERKLNTFYDFIASAEWLIANNYTRSEKLAIQGYSNGGILIGAVLNMRPDLFGAAIASTGVMDMLRFPLYTVGASSISEYGNPADSIFFKILYGYSAYHNIRLGVFPPVLVTSGRRDDRAIVQFSFKYAARLQAAQTGPGPILLRIHPSGHGVGMPASERKKEYTDMFSFLFRNLKMKWVR
jgi:prolyl oligopeptidase